MFLGGDRGVRRAVFARRGALLNARWHKPRASSTSPRCPACDADVPVSDHAVRYGGELYHPGCALYLR